MMAPAMSLLFRCSAPLLATTLAGCFSFGSPPPSSIEASDSGVFVPAIRASVDIPQGRDVPSQAHNGHAIEIGWSSGSGGDRQTIGAGQRPVQFAGQTFSAPAQLTHDFDYRFFEVGYRFRHFFGGDFGIEALAGLAHASLDLTVASASQRASESLDSGGLTAGFGLMGRLRPGTSVQGRATFFGGSNSSVSNAQRFELYLVQSLWRHAALRAGYVAWNVESEREDTGLSPIKVKFSGPSLGLDLAF
jgi:hypothetical protein